VSNVVDGAVRLKHWDLCVSLHWKDTASEKSQVVPQLVRNVVTLVYRKGSEPARYSKYGPRRVKDSRDRRLRWRQARCGERFNPSARIVHDETNQTWNEQEDSQGVFAGVDLGSSDGETWSGLGDEEYACSLGRAVSEFLLQIPPSEGNVIRLRNKPSGRSATRVARIK